MPPDVVGCVMDAAMWWFIAGFIVVSVCIILPLSFSLVKAERLADDLELLEYKLKLLRDTPRLFKGYRNKLKGCK